MLGSRLSRAALVCVLLCLVAGCTGILSDDVTEEEILTEFEDVEPPEEMSATIEINASFENERLQYAYEAWYRLGGESRTEGHLDGERVVEVNDGEQLWTYNTNESTVQVRESPDSMSPILGGLDATEELVRTGNATEIRETEYAGRDVYHVVFDTTDEIDDREDEEGFLPPLIPSTGGIVGGDAGEGVNENPNGNPLFDGNRVEFWIDAEYMFILRQKMEGENEFDMRYADVEFDPGLDDDLFEFEVPEDATVEEVDTPEFEEFDSVAEAREHVPFEIVEPEFATDEYDLDSAFVIAYEDADEAEVGLQYDVGEEFPLTVTKRNQPTDDPNGETVSVGEITGTYEELSGDLHRLTWEVDGFEYDILADREMDREALVRVAESMSTG